MKTTIWLLVCAFFIIYSSKPTVHFKPFAIIFLGISIIFLGISLILFQLQARREGKYDALEKYYKIGFKEGSDFTIEQINKKLKEKGNE